MKKILVTGCYGFIGLQLTLDLLKNNKVYGIDDFSSSSKNRKIKHKNFSFVEGDCGKKSILSKINSKIDFIFHLAGQSSGEKSYYEPLIDFEKNSLTTVRLLEFAKSKKCQRFIYASSMSVYGNLNKAKEYSKLNPISFYGISKMTSENYIKKYYYKGLNYTICRFFNVYGKNQELNNLQQGMLRIFLTQLKKTNKLIIKGSKNRFRDFINIKDVVNILQQIPKNSKSINQTINIGTGKKIFIKDLVKLLKKYNSKKFKVIYASGTPNDQFGVISNTTKFKEIFNYKLKFSKKSDLINVIKSADIK